MNTQYRSYFLVYIIVLLIVLSILAMPILDTGAKARVVIGYILWYIVIFCIQLYRVDRFIRKFYPNIWDTKKKSIVHFSSWKSTFSSEDICDDPLLEIVKRDYRYMRWFHYLHVFGLMLAIMLF
ncbi:c-di-AMP phosphodiesterase-like protein [Anaerosolibacter carboniphilus]|uniref:C-di-AMP phosphodiesterase-like protein n=1 Tax=Anaerosolibacter carboniphilus TaxID=1417629 RepID=A0A841KY47_9FIRM|nr:hypothetical protein [Anaerosolibacter carboniphilus]MBB6217228.1 c-di-AMP phosphodiesterase-like protein [Anaerosolibacter carboniphilus]